MAMIEVSGLKKSFGKLEVLKGVGFSVGTGDVIAIIGPSGSGKSTLLRSLIGLETIDEGTILVDGRILCATECMSTRHRQGRSPLKWEWCSKTSICSHTIPCAKI